MIYLAVRYLGQDPYALYNGPHAPQPPRFYSRIRTFIYGCGIYAENEEGLKVRAIGGASQVQAARMLGGGR